MSKTKRQIPKYKIAYRNRSRTRLLFFTPFTATEATLIQPDALTLLLHHTYCLLLLPSFVRRLFFHPSATIITTGRKHRAYILQDEEMMMMTTSRHSLHRFIALVALLHAVLYNLPEVSAQKVSCIFDEDCRGVVASHNGSYASHCVQEMEGSFCSNPFASGCLKNVLPEQWKKLRVCNSDDPSTAAAQGLCRYPFPVDAFEIRLFTQNWDSAMFEAWLLQIILSELLDIPTTVETGRPDSHKNFYHPTSALDGSTSNDLLSLSGGYEHGDCRLLREHNQKDADAYISCAHIVTEVWDTGLATTQDYVHGGILEPPQALGVLGQEGWYIPKFLAEKDPALLSYLGLQGEVNRQKLADTFKRPTTWGDYCAFVSPNNCTIPDATAHRAPANDWEQYRMFDEESGSYFGHFRRTEKNDCSTFPLNCTGHIADYPCGWSSYTEAQAYHLNIALEGDGDEPYSKGYSYSQLREIWLAANATKENTIIQWWSPDTLYQTFQGTDAEFVRVSMPSPTQECLRNRIWPGDRCSANFTDRVGNPEGVCDESVRPLQKLILARLGRDLNDPSIPEAIKSPAHDVLRLFHFSELQLDEIFRLWREFGNPREAVCTWASENMELYLQAFVPAQYPRIHQDAKETGALPYASVAFGGGVALVILLVAFIVYKNKEKHAFRIAQVEFLSLLLVGSFLVAMSAIIGGTEATNGSCVSEIWLLDLGYTLGLVPLMVRSRDWKCSCYYDMYIWITQSPLF